MTLVPTAAVTTATTTPSTISNLVSAISLWPSTSSASANSFVTRSWPKPQNEGNSPMSIPEGKQEVRAFDLSKYAIPPTRETTTSWPALSVTHNSALAKVMVAMNTLSPAKRYKRWGPLCPFCAQSALHPSPVKSDWSDEDLDGEIQKKKWEKQRKEEEMRQGQEEKEEILDSGYYPPEPMYVSHHEEQPPMLVNNLVLASEDPRDMQQDKSINKTEEDRRVIMSILDDERDVDYYSDSDSDL